jgi:hypothetical protein
MITHQQKRLLKLYELAFAEAYMHALNAVEHSGLSFTALNGDRVTVQNGRRLVVGKSK